MIFAQTSLGLLMIMFILQGCRENEPAGIKYREQITSVVVGSVAFTIFQTHLLPTPTLQIKRHPRLP